MRHGEKRVRSTARTELYQGVRFHAAGSLVNLSKEIGQCFNRVLGAFVLVRGIIARRKGVQGLAIQLEAVESPLAEDLPNQRFVVFHDSSVGRTQIKRVPPGNLPLRSVTIQQDEVGMIFK